MPHVHTLIAAYGEHCKHMSYALSPQDESAGIGMSLMLERVKKFTQTIQEDSGKPFLLRFVLCLIMTL